MIHPVVRDLFLDLGRHPGFQEVLHRVSAGGDASVSGLTTTAKAVYAVLLWQSAVVGSLRGEDGAPWQRLGLAGLRVGD